MPAMDCCRSAPRLAWRQLGPRNLRWHVRRRRAGGCLPRRDSDGQDLLKVTGGLTSMNTWRAGDPRSPAPAATGCGHGVRFQPLLSRRALLWRDQHTNAGQGRRWSMPTTASLPEKAGDRRFATESPVGASEGRKRESRFASHAASAGNGSITAKAAVLAAGDPSVCGPRMACAESLGPNRRSEWPADNFPDPRHGSPARACCSALLLTTTAPTALATTQAHMVADWRTAPAVRRRQLHPYRLRRRWA